MIRSILIATSALLVPACAGEAPEPEVEAGHAVEEHVKGETLATADLWMPDMEGEAEIDPYLAPLIYLETGAGAPGAPWLEAGGELRVRTEEPVVYYADATALLFEGAGGERRQVRFVWFREVAGSVQAQGVRMTFDAHGKPLVQEVLADSSGERLLYVTDNLESEAGSEFGEPLAGRSHVLESDALESVGARIAAVLAHGSAPMGPYVYLARDSADVASLHCRCSPDEVGEQGETERYALRPLAELEGLWDGGFGDPTLVARALRLPTVF